MGSAFSDQVGELRDSPAQVGDDAAPGGATSSTAPSAAGAPTAEARKLESFAHKKGSFRVEAAAADAYYAGSKMGANVGAIHCQGFAMRHELTAAARGLVIATVGLPGRGKSFIARKLEGFLKWQCMNTATFNAGKYRREAEGASESGRADFFDPENAPAKAARERAAMMALDDAIVFLDGGGEIAIFDATNSSDERRNMIVNRVKGSGKNYRVIFIEVICDDPEVLKTNFRNKVLHSPDFAGLSLEEAMEDLEDRVRRYEAAYETITDDSLSYIKLYNMSSKVLVNRIYGRVSKSIMPYLMGIHIGTRPIWLVRAGAVPTGEKKDAHLTERGHEFAKRVATFVGQRTCELREEVHDGELAALVDKPVRVLSSTQVNAVQTVMALLGSSSDDFLALHFKQTSALNPIDRGRLDGPWWIDHCTDLPPFDELKARDPAFHERWEANRLRVRFPGGESYYDVMTRAESVLLEMEMSTRPVLCVSHITCIQVLLSYFKGTPLEEAWKEPVPEHSVVEVIPTLGGSYRVEVINMSEDEPAGPEMRKVKTTGGMQRPRSVTVAVDNKDCGDRILRGFLRDADTPHNLDKQRGLLSQSAPT
eukprot:gb/GFBE01009100.1/.p1 GENE.gb/GFBE01009100.1/~~gb/GFBE01009100.1/.p1  ORF type:complete len:594 (+),score=117.83 gb/GFBE01009100.1/:1-1782(+)